MKHAVIVLITEIVASAIIFYLVGCFMNASFDIGKWDKEVRMTVGAIWLFVQVLAAPIVWAQALTLDKKQ